MKRRGIALIVALLVAGIGGWFYQRGAGKGIRSATDTKRPRAAALAPGTANDKTQFVGDQDPQGPLHMEGQVIDGDDKPVSPRA